MQGMDGGPWTALGTFAWFLGVWVVMMAAMMLPSVAPTVALYSRMTRSRSPSRRCSSRRGYLVAWARDRASPSSASPRAAAGSGATCSPGTAAGRWVAGATLSLPRVYELTPLKDVCLGKCRSPLGFLLGSWRGGASGALRMGVRPRRAGASAAAGR